MHALIAAIQDGDMDKLADILTDPDVNPDVIEDGMTPLLWASQFGHADMVRALVQRGADPNLAADEGETPLHVAAAEACIGCVDALLEAGATVEARTELGKTPLMNASQAGALEVIEKLLAGGADVHAVDAAGRTALHWAIVGTHDDPAVARRLAAAGADPSRHTELGDTALDYARAMNKTALEQALKSP